MNLSSQSCVQFLVILATVIATSTAAQPAEGKAPNFVIINIDDMGYADI